MDYREGPVGDDAQGIVVYPGGGVNDLAICDGAWDAKCLEQQDGNGAALSYSDGSAKETWAFGSGAWRVIWGAR